MDVHLQRLAATQVDVVAAWQLMACGWTRKQIRHRARRDGWRIVHAGVYALTYAPLTAVQRWMAAALTAPDTYLSHLSAAACWGFHVTKMGVETVTRLGSGGPRRLGRVVVRRSHQLAGETTLCGGIPITTPARTLIDIAAALPQPLVGRAFREAIRLKLLTTRDLAMTLSRHRRRRGTRALWDLTERYSSLPYRRTRSNAEARALEVLHDADIRPPKVNMRVGGEEADLVWPRQRVIIEIDGPQFHQFSDEDARKQGIWERAGYIVSRIPSNEIYARPNALIALAPR
jgi:very-short-patch-repair endonuclease